MKAFDSGDHALDDYLRRHAWTNQSQNLVGSTYVALDQASQTVCGYYTLATAGIARSLLPESVVKNLPSYSNLPAALLARLAVARSLQGSGLGKQLLRHAFENLLGISKQVGCRYLIVDAYSSAVGWYAKFGFVAIGGTESNRTQQMFIDLRTVESAIR